jgi:hypothetical protein
VQYPRLPCLTFFFSSLNSNRRNASGFASDIEDEKSHIHGFRTKRNISVAFSIFRRTCLNHVGVERNSLFQRLSTTVMDFPAERARRSACTGNERVAAWRRHCALRHVLNVSSRRRCRRWPAGRSESRVGAGIVGAGSANGVIAYHKI